MRTDKTLYVVIPCYKEEEVLPETAKRLKEKMTALMTSGRISENSRVLFVSDGTKDRTWEVIAELQEQDKLFSSLKCSLRNLSVLLSVTMKHADMYVFITDGIQDGIHTIDEMIDAYHEGYDVIYGTHSPRGIDTSFHRATADQFFMHKRLLGADTAFARANYRLISKRVAEGIRLSYTFPILY